MPRPITLNVNAALRELGVKGGLQMELADGPIQPVIIMSDQARSFVAERSEPRGVLSGDVTQLGLAATEAVEFLFLNRGEGGVVIESLAVNVPRESLTSVDLIPSVPAFDPSAIVMFQRPPTKLLITAGPELNILRVGAPVRSQAVGMRWGTGPTFPGGGGQEVWFGTPFTATTPWFIGPGVQLSVRGNAILNFPGGAPPIPRMTFAMTFREIPAISGGP